MKSNNAMIKSYLQSFKDDFEAIAQIGSYEALSEEDRNRYDDALRNYRDSIAVYKAAIKKGLKKGRKEGLKKGLKKGRKEGEYTYAVRIAISLIKQGFNDDMIITTSELPKGEIEKLRAQYEIEQCND